MKDSRSKKKSRRLIGIQPTGKKVFVTKDGQCTEFERIPHARVNAAPGTPVDSRKTMIPTKN